MHHKEKLSCVCGVSIVWLAIKLKQKFKNKTSNVDFVNGFPLALMHQMVALSLAINYFTYKNGKVERNSTISTNDVRPPRNYYK